MSESYTPDPAAIPVPPWTTVRLSQRDVSLNVPINFVPQPGVYLSSACFAHGVYKDDDAVACISNLLAVGFQKLIVDLYWDDGRQVWSFCPASLSQPLSSSAKPSSTSQAAVSGSKLTSGFLSSGSFVTTSSSASGRFSTSQASISPSTSQGARIKYRAQGTSFPTSIPSSSTGQLSFSGIGNALASNVPSVSSLPPTPDTPYISVGPYVCTTSINVSILNNLLFNYIEKTEFTLDAHILYIMLNLHTAAPASSPSKPGLKPKLLPKPSSLLGTIFDSTLHPYLYTPALLQEQRQNLNQSWYKSDPRFEPDPSYFTIEVLQDGTHSSPDGWPGEGYIEFVHGRRILFGWGSVDPQMTGYNFTGDEEIIFPQGELETWRAVAIGTSGAVTSGCFFNADDTELARVNSSWAAASQSQYPDLKTDMLSSAFNLTDSLVSCGISPVLNSTILNATASGNPFLYLNLSNAATWSWRAEEPQNSSHSSSDGSSSSTLFRCATMDLSVNGRWKVDNCSQQYVAACREKSQPYVWKLGDFATSFSSASQTCPSGTVFSVPRTALENEYLRQALVKRNDRDINGIWIDYNSNSVQGCWVTGGQNATCPYYVSTDTERRVTVIVPTIAAIIVIIIAGLTVFVKCNTNRRVSKRKKKREEPGWDYEGVPS